MCPMGLEIPTGLQSTDLWDERIEKSKSKLALPRTLCLLLPGCSVELPTKCRSSAGSVTHRSMLGLAATDRELSRWEDTA